MCALRPLSRGHHGPDMPLLSEPRAPLQGVLPGTSRRPALPHPPQKRRAAPVLSTRSRAVIRPGEGQRVAGADDLPGLPCPFSASGIGNPLHVGLAGPLRSGRSVSHALAGLRLPRPVQVCCTPVTLLGFDLQGVLLPQGRASLEAPSSLAVAKPAFAGEGVHEPGRLQRFAPSGSPYRRASGEARQAADPLLAFDPLGLSLLLPRRRLPGASSPALGRPRPRGPREACAAESRLAGGPAAPRGVPAPLGFATSSVRQPRGCLPVSVTGGRV